MSNLESEYYMQQNYWWKLKKGRGIRVKIIDDIDKETGKQKYRPAIVIKSYPSHVKLQLMTTEPSNHDYFKIKIDNQIQYIRPIYYRTIKFNEIADIWKDKYNKPIQLDKNSTLFTKIQEMEIKENLGYEINLNKTQSLEKDNKKIIEQKIKIAKENQKKWLKIKIIITLISTLIGLIILLITVSKN